MDHTVIKFLLALAVLCSTSFGFAETDDEIDKEIQLLEKQFNEPEPKITLKRVKNRRAKRTAKKARPRKNQVKINKNTKAFRPLPKKTVKVKKVKKYKVAKIEKTPIQYNSPAPQFVRVQEDEYDYSYDSRKRNPWGLNVYAFYSSADSISTSNNTQNSYTVYQRNFISDYTNEFQTGSAMGLGVEYSKKSLIKTSSIGFGFSAGASYEFERTINRGYMGYSTSNRTTTTTSTSARNTYYGENPSLAVILPYANVNMSFNDSYVYTGLNYSLPSMSGAADEEYNGEIGYQVGVGTQISDYMAVEFVHRWVNFSAQPIYPNSYYFPDYTSNNTGYRDQREGLGILEHEDLELKGFNLNLIATF